MALDRLPSLSLLPDTIPDADLTDCWFDSIAPFFDSLPATPLQALSVRPSHWQYHVGQCLFLDTVFPAQHFLRDSVMRRRNDHMDHLLVQVFVKGANQAHNDGVEFVQAPDTVSVVDLGRDVAARSTDSEVLTLVLPRDLVDDHLPHLRNARGLLFEPGGMASRLFSDFMLSLRRNLPAAAAADAPVIMRSIMGMLAPLTSHRDPMAHDAKAGVFAAMARFIDANLADPRLGVAMLCAHFRLSRATLFRLFKEQGGVSGYIQHRRLMACFRALGEPGQDHRLIYQVALDHGISSASHLTALCRRHFGVTPREIRDLAAARRAAAHRAAVDARPDGMTDLDVMRHWVRTLRADGMFFPA